MNGNFSAVTHRKFALTSLQHRIVFYDTYISYTTLRITHNSIPQHLMVWFWHHAKDVMDEKSLGWRGNKFYFTCPLTPPMSMGNLRIQF